MLARNAVSAGTAAALANDRKMRLMGEQCAREGMVLVPFSVESMGVFTATAINMVTQLACVSRNFMEFLSSNVAHICKCHHCISFKI